MQKKLALYVALFSLFVAHIAHSQGVGDSLIVHLKNGSRMAIPLSDIRKITFDTVTAGVSNKTSTQAGLQLSPSYPNPTRAAAGIDFTIPQAGSVTLSISNSRGDAVRTLTAPNCQAGANHLFWDGLDDHSTAVQSGTYFYEVRFKGDVQTRKVVVVR